MHAFDIKENRKQSLTKDRKSPMLKNPQRETESVSQFLKPNYPNMFQCRKFERTYRSKSTELDEFTAPDGEIKKISEESQAWDGKVTELIIV